MITVNAEKTKQRLAELEHKWKLSKLDYTEFREMLDICAAFSEELRVVTKVREHLSKELYDSRIQLDNLQERNGVADLIQTNERLSRELDSYRALAKTRADGEAKLYAEREQLKKELDECREFYEIEYGTKGFVETERIRMEHTRLQNTVREYEMREHLLKKELEELKRCPCARCTNEAKT